MVWKYVASLQEHPYEKAAASENCFDLWLKVYSKYVNDERWKITALENHYTLFGQITKQTLILSPENLNKTNKFEGWDLKKKCVDILFFTWNCVQYIFCTSYVRSICLLSTGCKWCL